MNQVFEVSNLVLLILKLFNNIVSKQSNYFDFQFLNSFTLDFSFSIPAQTENRIFIICVHNDKLLVIFVSRSLTIIEVGCLHNSPINQRLKKIKYYDSFDSLIIFWLICFRSCKTKKGTPSTEKSKISNNQIWFFWFFDSFDFEKKILQTDRQTDRQTDQHSAL